MLWHPKLSPWCSGLRLSSGVQEAGNAVSPSCGHDMVASADVMSAHAAAPAHPDHVLSTSPSEVPLHRARQPAIGPQKRVGTSSRSARKRIKVWLVPRCAMCLKLCIRRLVTSLE
jgi:hypothetical protein